jgi:hypothetical protein
MGAKPETWILISKQLSRASLIVWLFIVLGSLLVGGEVSKIGWTVVFGAFLIDSLLCGFAAYFPKVDTGLPGWLHLLFAAMCGVFIISTWL